MMDQYGFVTTDQDDARLIAGALEYGPVRFVWTDGTSAYPIYLVPARSIKTVLKAEGS